MSEISTKPYLLRAIYEWCTDSGYTAYLAAKVDAQTRVPNEFVKDGEIVLNISFTATSGLKMDNDFIHFNARFAGVSRTITVPVENVIAIYARENGQGMAFEVSGSIDTLNQEQDGQFSASLDMPSSISIEEETENVDIQSKGTSKPLKKGTKPTLTRIK